MAPTYKYTDVEKVLKRLWFTFDRQTGSHRVWEKDEVKKRITVIVPAHKPLKIGTFRNILKQAGISLDEFLSLLKRK